MNLSSITYFYETINKCVEGDGNLEQESYYKILNISRSVLGFDIISTTFSDINYFNPYYSFLFMFSV